MNNNGYEIELKYLIALPSSDFLQGKQWLKMEQTYLKSDNACANRIRKTTDTKGAIRYFHTEKKDITPLTREEKEQEISASEYEKLLKNADTLRKTIQKTRYFAPLDGFIFEIDIYDFSKKVAIMEVELASESARPQLLPQVTIIRDVTNDRAYSNKSLALALPQEFLT